MKSPITKEVLQSRILVKPETGCWIYMGVSGEGLVDLYPRTKVRGKTILIHRLSYMLYVGPIPDGLDLLHSCNNPHCCNPAHLRAGTHTENMQDKVLANTQHRPTGGKNVKAKLSEEQVRLILADPRKVSVIAAEYGVTRTNIHDIRARNTWTHIDATAVCHEQHMNRKLTPEQVAAIRIDPRVYRIIATDYGVNAQTICNVKKERFYRAA